MAGVGHVLMFGAVSLAVGLPLLFIRRSGLLGSRERFEKAHLDLRLHGRVVLHTSIMGGMLGIRTLTISGDRLSVDDGKRTTAFAWTSIVSPFNLQEGLRESNITFVHRRKNPRFGQRRLFRKTLLESEFVEARHSITSAYGLGWGNLATLLNSSRGLFRENTSAPLPLFTSQLNVCQVDAISLPESKKTAVPDERT